MNYCSLALLRKAEGGEDLQPSKPQRTQNAAEAIQRPDVKLEVAEGAAEAKQRPIRKRKDAERSSELMPRPYVKRKVAERSAKDIQRPKGNSKVEEDDTTRKIVKVFCKDGPTIEKVKSIR